MLCFYITFGGLHFLHWHPCLNLYSFYKTIREIKYADELPKDHSADKELGCQNGTTGWQALARKIPL